MGEMKAKCVDCKFYGHEFDCSGFCYRYPPTVEPGTDGDIMVRPLPNQKDWCGEFIRAEKPTAEGEK
jgi:hypothetical protein